MELDKIRENIDKIDKEICQLFEKRMECVEGVIEYKIKHNMEILDSGREKQIIEKNMNNLKNGELADYYREILELMMNVSKKYQKKILDKK